MREGIARTFLPIVRGFALPVALFYLLVIPTNFYFSPFSLALELSLISGSTAVAVGLCRIYLCSGRTISYGRIEAVNVVVLLLMYANCLNVLRIDFQPLNLFYPLILLMLSAAAAVSLRVFAACAVVTVSTVLIAAGFMGLGYLAYFGVAASAVLASAVGVAVLVRLAIRNLVRERLISDEMRERSELFADYDALTGLPNRRHFFAHADTIVGCGESDRVLHLGLIDLDGFKPVNDLYGHVAGDELLVQAGMRIREVCAEICPNVLVARLGGDEFAILLEKPLREAELRAIGRRICDELCTPFTVGDTGVSVSCSIGFAQYPRDGRTVHEVYERADHALSNAKQHARGDTVVFRPEDETHLGSRARIEQALRTADLHREIFLQFQPQHDLLTGRVSGLEALVRWESPTLGRVNPNDFIVTAERTGYIQIITGIVVQKAMAAAGTWPDDVGLSINLSAVDIVSERAMAGIAHLVEESGLDPSRLTFEITETAVMTDFTRACRSLEMLKRLGCRIALDDFGSGYSSFAYIHRLPLDRIKTDRSFIAMLHRETEPGFKILRTVGELSLSLGFDCLAEGVETKEQLDIVRATGIRHIQGYYFSRPLNAEAVDDYLAKTGQGRHSAHLVEPWEPALSLAT